MLGNDEISRWNHEHRLWLLVDMVWISCEFLVYSGNVDVFVVNDSVATIAQSAEYLHWSEREYANCTHGWLFPGCCSNVNSNIFLLVILFPTCFIPHCKPFSSFLPANVEEVFLLLSVVCHIHSLWPVGNHFNISDTLRGCIVFHYFLDWYLLYRFNPVIVSVTW